MALAAIAAGADDVDLWSVRENFHETLDAPFVTPGLTREQRELRMALGLNS